MNLPTAVPAVGLKAFLQVPAHPEAPEVMQCLAHSVGEVESAAYERVHKFEQALGWHLGVSQN